MEKLEINATDGNFKQEVLKSDLPVLMDFWAAWCDPCQMVAPMVEAIAKKYDGKFKMCKVNVDEAPNTLSEYGIMSISTLAIFKDGKVVYKVIGALSKSELEAVVKKYI